MLRKYFLLSVTLLTALPCLAGGFQVSLQGQKQTGMSHVGAALPLDGSAIYFNPGALSFVGGTHVNVGLSLGNPLQVLHLPKSLVLVRLFRRI